MTNYPTYKPELDATPYLDFVTSHEEKFDADSNTRYQILRGVKGRRHFLMYLEINDPLVYDNGNVESYLFVMPEYTHPTSEDWFVDDCGDISGFEDWFDLSEIEFTWLSRGEESKVKEYFKPKPKPLWTIVVLAVSQSNYHYYFDHARVFSSETGAKAYADSFDTIGLDAPYVVEIEKGFISD